MKKAKKVETLFLAVLILTVMSPLTLDKPVNAQQPLETIFIKPDGTIYPNTAPIHQNGNTYTLTGNMYGAIKILKSNVILDGAGYTLTGPFMGNSTDIWIVGQGPYFDPLNYYTIGVDLGNRSVCGVTVQNLKVENFSIGMYIWTQNNTIKGNVVSNNVVGLLVSGSNTTMTGNYISDNIEGLFFGFNSPETFPPDMVVYQNAFLRNNVQLGGCQCQSYNLSEPPHNWDNGITGNYWSDYNGTDENHDGTGDTPYVIDILDLDRFPIMQNPVKSPAQPVEFPVETVVLGISILFMLVAVAFAVKQRKKRRRIEETSK
jgi:parallel beta-helix repeat protein